MKKVIFSFIGAAIIACAVVFNFSISSRSDSMSDLALANMEALASSECWTVGECCSSSGMYESCGFCYGFYMTGC